MTWSTKASTKAKEFGEPGSSHPAPIQTMSVADSTFGLKACAILPNPEKSTGEALSLEEDDASTWSEVFAPSEEVLAPIGGG